MSNVKEGTAIEPVCNRSPFNRLCSLLKMQGGRLANHLGTEWQSEYDAVDGCIGHGLSRQYVQNNMMGRGFERAEGNEEPADYQQVLSQCFMTNLFGASIASKT